MITSFVFKLGKCPRGDYNYMYIHIRQILEKNDEYLWGENAKRFGFYIETHKYFDYKNLTSKTL